MTSASDRRADIDAYVAAYRATYTFEAVMVRARQRMVQELVNALSPRVVVEIGCGSDLLCNALREPGRAVTQWVIVEPSPDFAEYARKTALGDGQIDIIEGFLEESVGDVLAACTEPPALVICSGVLHEVPDAGLLLRATRAVLDDSDGLLHVNVPNAKSFHRRLAAAMGLITSEYEMSDRNRLLNQKQVYDAASLQRALEAEGFRVKEVGGYFVKPFTHDQMTALPFLTDSMVDGLWRLGRELPEIASEIFVNAIAAR